MFKNLIFLQKKTILSKTFFLGILTVAGGLYQGIIGNDWNAGSKLIILGLAMITGRDAIAKIQ